MRAAIYVRVSREKQAEEGASSLQEQERRCRELAQRRGWAVVEVYTEAGFTGTAESRPEWDRLMADARTSMFDVLVVFNVKRFARSARVGLNLAYQLKDECGVLLTTVEGDLNNTTPDGEMMMTVQLAFAQRDRDAIVQQTAEAHYRKAERGLWPGGGLSYGYRQVGRGRNASIELHPQETAMLRRVVDWIVDEGLSRCQATARMNAEGYRTRSGGFWRDDGLRDVLTNTALKGEMWWGKGRQTRKGYKPSGSYGDPVMIEVKPAVLTEQRWDQLRQAIAARRRVPGQRRTYLLNNGRMTSPCGLSYGGWHRGGGAGRYRCRGRRWSANPDHVKCDCPTLRADEVDARVWQQVARLLDDPHQLQHLATQYLELRLSRATLESEAGELVKLKADTTRLEARLRDDVADYLRQGVSAAVVQSAVGQLERDLAAMRDRRQRLEALQAETEAHTERVRAVSELAYRAADRLAGADIDQQVEVLALLQLRVEVLDHDRDPALRIFGTVPFRWLNTTDGGGTLISPLVVAGDDADTAHDQSRVPFELAV